jgi:NAD(P)-dependent dehydrogenase (short-subunit alcohol dehydrogenase family)
VLHQCVLRALLSFFFFHETAATEIYTVPGPPSLHDALPIYCVEDIGRAVVFLAGPDARYLTGAILPLDGGAGYVR